jgi:CheY-like chemotaxis protein
MSGHSFNPDAGILVVDDHAISRYFLIKALRQFSDNIQQARTGQEAIASACSRYPGLIFTDIHLPDICGLSVIQEIKSKWPPERKQPHIVIITGDDSSRLRQKVQHANVAGILLKPVRLEDVRACARELMTVDNRVQETSEQTRLTVNNHELRKLFSRELATRLPRLDAHIAQLDWKPANEILHQLIASSAMCREKELENCSRLLYRATAVNSETRAIAQAYYSFLKAASQAKMYL